MTPQHDRLIPTALIGLGPWGNLLLKNMAECPLLEVVGIFDRNADKREKAKAVARNSTLFSSAESLIDSKAKLIVIASPASTHFEFSKLALKAGKDVLVEKPLTTSLKEAEALEALAADQGRKIFLDHTYLFSPNYFQFKAQLKEKCGGKVLFRSERYDFGRFPKDCGILSHLLYHDLYVLDDLYGLENLKVENVFTRQVLSPYRDDFATVELTDRKGNAFHLVSNMAHPTKVRQVSVASCHGILLWDDTSNTPITFHRRQVKEQNGKLDYVDEGVESLPKPKGAMALESLVTEVAQSVLSNTSPRVGIQAGIRVMKFIELLESKGGKK